MTDQTRQALEHFVQQLLAGATEQAPLLVQEWVRWQMIDRSIGLVFGLVATVLISWAARYVWRLGNADHHNDWAIGASSLLTVAGAFSAVMTAVMLSSLLQTVAAPRVVVLEGFLKLLK